MKRTTKKPFATCPSFSGCLQRIFRRLFPAKPQRLELKLATYSEAGGLLRAGWSIAPEEDGNRAFGHVYLERLF